MVGPLKVKKKPFDGTLKKLLKTQPVSRRKSRRKDLKIKRRSPVLKKTGKSQK
jgi:hypothetical protein